MKPYTKKTECSCAKCQSACENTPGWFRPGEAELAAKHLGLTLRQFFRRYLGVNWWGDVAKGDVFVLAPATVRMEPGLEYPANPKGRCVFFTADRRCQIHPVKPFGCSVGNPCDFSLKPFEAAMAKTVKLWRAEQGQVEKLLGRKPITKELDLFEALFGLR